MYFQFKTYTTQPLSHKAFQLTILLCGIIPLIHLKCVKYDSQTSVTRNQDAQNNDNQIPSEASFKGFKEIGYILQVN